LLVSILLRVLEYSLRYTYEYSTPKILDGGVALVVCLRFTRKS